MKYYFLIPVFIAVLICTASCRMNVMKGEGNKTTNTPAVGSFNAVEIDLSLKAVLTIQQGAVAGVTFSGYENLLKHIKAVVENNKLRIYSDLDATWTMESGDVAAQITLPALASLTLSGAPDAEVHGNVTGNEFKLDISGASSVKMDSVNTDNFSLDVSGAADVVINGGTVKKASFEINGAGDVKAFPLQANEAIASISGAGTCNITATGKLTSDISGAGTINYKGHPVISKEVSGAGTISDAN